MTPSPTRESLLHSVVAPGTEAASSKRSDFWNPTLSIAFVRRTLRGLPLLSPPVDDYDPGRGIILHFSTHTVKIAGRNLKALYAELLELKLRHIVVVAEEHDLEGPEAVVVHRVGVKQDDGTTRGGLDQPEQRSR